MRVARLEKLDGTKELRRCYSIEEFSFSWLDSSTISRKGKKAPHKYMKLICTFDIESTTIKDVARPFGFMYIFTISIGGYSIYANTWNDFLYFLERCKEHFKLSNDKRLIIWVQNLSFEMQFMTPFLASAYGDLEVFATDKRKPIKLTCPSAGIEFRCTYRLSNMALDKMCKFEKGMTHRKLSGDLDYSIIRTPKTHLKLQEFSYCISDTVTLAEWIKCVLVNNNDTFFTMPVTSTGYVRRDCRNSTRKARGYRNYFKKNALTVSVYKMLKEAGRGGNTHANRALANKILEDVDSWDLVSSYIYSLLARKYPISKFTNYGRVDSIEELEALAKKYALLFRVTLVNPRVKKHVPFPYLPISKKTGVTGTIVNDNGRVLRVEAPDKGLATISYTLTDVDWEIVSREYDYDAVMIYDVHIAKRGYLPSCIRDTIKDYFIKKCQLKEKIKEAKRWLEDLEREHKEHTKAYAIHKQELADFEYLYAKMKNRLNGIFGMMYTDVCRLSYNIDSETGDWLEPEKITDEFIAKALDDYNNSYNSFLVYAHGVFCTAWSRLSFEELTEACNNSKYGNTAIYGDTDSNKAKIKDETPILKFNERVMKQCEKTGAYAIVNGNKYYLGIAEKETKKEKYKKFKTMGAKKYCYFDSEGLHVTVSGVVKNLAPKELKSVENFCKGFTFHKAGGKTLYYNDERIHTIEVDGCEIETASNVGLIDSTYTLGLTTDYERILALFLQGY